MPQPEGTFLRRTEQLLSDWEQLSTKAVTEPLTQEELEDLRNIRYGITEKLSEYGIVEGSEMDKLVSALMKEFFETGDMTRPLELALAYASGVINGDISVYFEEIPQADTSKVILHAKGVYDRDGKGKNVYPQQNERIILDLSTNSICIVNEQGEQRIPSDLTPYKNLFAKVLHHDSKTPGVAGVGFDFVEILNRREITEGKPCRFLAVDNTEREINLSPEQRSAIMRLIPLVIGSADNMERARRRLEEIIEEKTAEWKKLSELSPSGVTVTDEAGNFLFVNKAFADLVGYTVDELRAMNVTEIYWNPEQRKGIIEKMQQTDGDNVTFEIEFRHKNGKKIVIEARETLLKEHNDVPNCILATTRDKTTEKALDEERRKMEEEIRRRVHEQTVELANKTMQLEQLAKELENMLSDIVKILAKAVNVKDRLNPTHAESVEKMATILLETFSDDELIEIFAHGDKTINPQLVRDSFVKAMVLHDIGKIGIPEAILNKIEKLSREQRDIIEKHPLIGSLLLKKLTPVTGREFTINLIRLIAERHHERRDGRGYPQGRLQRYPSVLLAEFLDRLDALVTERPYKPAYEYRRAIRILFGEEEEYQDHGFEQEFTLTVAERSAFDKGLAVAPYVRLILKLHDILDPDTTNEKYREAQRKLRNWIFSIPQKQEEAMDELRALGIYLEEEAPAKKNGTPYPSPADVLDP